MSKLKVNEISPFSSAGIGSGAPDSETCALLDLVSTTQGIVFPRMTTVERNAIMFPVRGLVIYNTTLLRLEEYNGSTWNPALGTPITELFGDVSATGPGIVAATVNFVGGSSASNVNLATVAANNATDLNTPNTIVKRDVNGDFSAGIISANLNGTANLAVNVTGVVALINGGTGIAAGSANIAFAALSPLTTKGDLLVFGTINDRLPVGVNGQALVADSTQTLGVKWAPVGDFSSNTATSVDGEVVLFDGTTGKSGRRATGTGVAHLTSGVLSASSVNLTSEVTGVLPLLNGGTGIAAASSNAAFNALSPITTLGDIIYGDVGVVNARLAGNITTNRQFLSQTGTGTVSAAPIWSVLTSSDIPNNASNTTGTSSNVTGIIAVANGGTNITTYTTGDILYASATNVLSKLPIGTTNQYLQVIGGVPTWQTITGSGITTLNTLTATSQTFVVGTSGTDFNISSVTSTHTFNIPDASATARGLMTIGAQTIAGAKTFTSAIRSNISLILEDPGVGTNTTTIQAGTVGTSYSLTLPINVATFNDGMLVSDTTGVLTYKRSGHRRLTSAATAATTTTLTNNSNPIGRFTGTTLGQVVNLGDATTYDIGWTYIVQNESTQMIQVVDNGSNELSRVGPGENANFTLDDNGSSNGTWNVKIIPNIDQRYAAYSFEDFISPFTTGQTSWQEVSTGTNSTSISTVANTTTANHPGILQMTKGTTAAGRAALWKGGDVVYFSGGVSIIEYLVNIQNLSDGTTTYNFRIGWGDDTGASDHVDGVYFEYDSTTSANWLIKTSNNSTRTTTTSSTVVATGWNRMRIEVNADGTRVDYFVNGTNIGNITTNIPITAARATGACMKVVGSVGNTARNFLLDYVRESYYFGSARG